MEQVMDIQKFYGYPSSGNSYKVHFLMHYLNIPHEMHVIDIVSGGSRTRAFLEKNPAGQIPLLELADGSHLAESHAILWYLADLYDFLPASKLERAKIMQWLCFEQYSLEPNIAVLRYQMNSLGKTPEELGAVFTEKQAKGFQALDVVERVLSTRPFLVGRSFTLADLALYAYTHTADEGGCPLTDYPYIRAWIDRITALPDFYPQSADLAEPA